MANIASYPEWYDRSGNVIPRMDITEVEVVSTYTLTGNEIVSWDISHESDGSATAHIIGTKLILVCDSLTVIPDKMFFKFLELEKVSGLQSITTIGGWAFFMTPMITDIDIVPSQLSHIGSDAFRLSGIEDVLDLSDLSVDILGNRATRNSRWSESELAAIRSVTFPSDRIYLDVPNADSQLRYDDIPYAIHNGATVSIAQGACRTLSCYHAWNALYAGTDKEYSDFLTWFNDKLNTDGKYAERTELNENNRLRDYVTLGWKQTGAELVTSHAQLEYILNELNNGFPVYISMHASTEYGYHSVVCVGCDINTRKLAIVDSAVRDDTGVVYWAAYEDLFTEDNTDTSEMIRKLDYNQPVLAASDLWFTQGGTAIAKSTITEIEIVASYTPSGNETEFWDASAKMNGSVMAYVNGTKIIISGNGDKYVYANPDSTYAFSDASSSKRFTNLTRIGGAEILNTRKVRALSSMFAGCTRLSSVDPSGWDTSSCIRMDRVFQILLSLQKLDLSKWNVSNVTTMQMMFQGHVNYGASGLISVGDLSNWNTKNVTTMVAMFNHCKNLKDVNVRNWDVSKVTDFRQMFRDCQSLKELDFSNWNVSGTATAHLMFENNYRLEKIIVSDKFDFNDAVFPSTSSTYIPGADGNWYTRNRTPYTPADIPNMTANTYYATKDLVNDIDILIKNGSVLDIADAIRSRTGKTEKLNLEDFVAEILAIPDVETYINEEILGGAW